MGLAVSVTYAFGDFELDADRFELRRAGEKVEVQPKVLRLLLHLIVHRERAVTSDELLRELWPNTRVEPGSLKRAVSGARHALSERDAERSCVRTIRGYGYQFVGEVLAHELASPPPPLAAGAPRPETRGMFVGREALLELLDADLTGALRGHSCCVLLTGEPGIGKTRIAEELWQRARQLGAETWLGRCTEGEGVPAFWPFVQVFREAMRERGAEQMRELTEHAGPDMARALHALPGAAPQATHCARFRLFDEIALFLRLAAERRPVVLGFDDLHLADAATLQLLAFIVRQAFRAPLFILGTFRRDPRGPAPLLAALASTDRTRCIELVGLSREDLARYLELTTGAAPPAFAVDALHAQTAGNPLFVRQLVESSSTRSASSDWRTLVHSSSGYGLEGAIEQHLRVVPEACSSLLRTAAVLGREFSDALLMQLAELTLDQVRAQLTAAEATRLIEPRPAPGRYGFSHGLIRDALYQQLPAAERARLHGRAGRALEAQALGHDYVALAEITHHFVLAAPTHDERRALHYTLQAAETALARFAYEEAAEHFQAALHLCSYEPADPARRMQLCFRLGDALCRSAEFEAAKPALFDALHAAQQLGDLDMSAKTALLLAVLPDDSSVDPAKVNALRDLLAAMAEGDARRVCVQACLAKALAYGSDRAERVALAREALRGAHAIADLRTRSEVLTRCHEALVDPEHLRERVAIGAELLQLADRQGDTQARLRAWSAQIETSVERGDMHAALDAASRMESVAERVREPFFRWHAKIARAMEAYVFGQLKLAEERAHDALAYGAPMGADGARHVFAVQVTGVYSLQGRLQEAEPLAHEMALRYPGLPGWEARIGALDGLQGRYDQARARLTRMMSRGLDWISREPFALSGLCSVAELCGVTRDAEASRALYPALAPFADHHGVTALAAGTYGPVTFYLGVLAACSGEMARACAHFEAAYAAAARLKSATFSALTGAAYGELLIYLGQRDQRARASELLTSALAVARSCQLHAISQTCLQLASRHDLALNGHPGASAGVNIS